MKKLIDLKTVYESTLTRLAGCEEKCRRCDNNMQLDIATLVNYDFTKCEKCEVQKQIDEYNKCIRHYDTICKIEKTWRDNVPVDYINYRITDYLESVQKQAMDFINGDALYMFVFSKNNGTRKTTLIWSIEKQMSFKTGNVRKAINEADLIIQYAEITGNYFCLDDVGKVEDTYKKKIIQNYYYRVINYAKEHHVKMILTTNKSPDEFIAWIDSQEIRNAINERLKNRVAKIELN